MQQIKKIILLVFLFSSSSPIFADAGAFILEKGLTVMDKIVGGSLSYDQSDNFGISSLDFWAGFGLGAGYSFHTSHQNEMYLRMDEFRYQLGVDTSKTLSILPANFGITNMHKLRSFRLFKTLTDLYNANPFDAIQFPYTADDAKKNFPEGNRLVFPAILNLRLGLQSFPIAQLVRVQGATSLVFSGVFQVSLMKLPEQKIRVQLLSMNHQLQDLSGVVKIPFSLVGIGLIDNLINNQLELDLVNTGLNHQKKEAFIADYIFDLKSPVGAKAYDDLLHHHWMWQELKALSPLKDCSNLNNCLVGDLEALDKLSETDPAVERVNKAKVVKNELNNHFKVGLIIAKSEKSSTTALARIQMQFKKSEDFQYYLHPTTNAHSESSALFGLYQSKKNYSTGLLYDSNPQFESFNFNSFLTGFSREDTYVDIEEVMKLKIHLLKNLPLEIYQAIPWNSDWKVKGEQDLSRLKSTNLEIPLIDQLDEDLLQVRAQSNHQGEKLFGYTLISDSALSYRIGFNRQFTDFLSVINLSDLPLITSTFIDEIKSKGFNKVVTRYAHEDYQKLFSEIFSLFRQTQIASTDEFSPTKLFLRDSGMGLMKWWNLIFLSNNPMFRDIGIGYLLHANLFYGHALEEIIQLEVKLKAAKKQNIDFHFGSSTIFTCSEAIDSLYQLMNY